MKELTISTFGGGPIPTAAAKAVIDLIEEENLAANAAEMGGYLRAGLEDLQEKHPLIGDVRGMGLMQAIELVQDREIESSGDGGDAAGDGSGAGEPDSDRARRTEWERHPDLAAAEYSAFGCG